MSRPRKATRGVGRGSPPPTSAGRPTTALAVTTGAPRPGSAPLGSLLWAMEDDALFASHFPDDTWHAWKVFIRALYALPITDPDDIALYRETTGREDFATKPYTEACCVVGRRGGKSKVLAAIAVWAAVSRDYSKYLAAGEVGRVLVLSSNREQSKSIFNFALGLLNAVDYLRSMVVNSTNDEIELSNHITISIATASFRSVRGVTTIAVCADEVAFWRSSDDSSVNPDSEILRALRPSMATIPGGLLLLASSPYHQKGELYQTYRRNFGRPGARVLTWKAPTWKMNPVVPKDVIAEAYESDEESARAEYGADFRADLSDFINRDAIDAVTAFGRTELPPISGVTYTAFCDPSGGRNDAMTMAIAHVEGDKIVLDCVRESRPSFDPDVVVVEYAEVLKRYGISRVTGDRYAGAWVPSRFAAHGIVYEPSAMPKSDIYISLLPVLTSERVELLDNKRLAAELCGLERRTSRSGRDSVDHQRDGHDDLANAVAGAVVACDLDRRPALVARSSLLQGEEPYPIPLILNGVYAVACADKKGNAAVAYFGVPPFGDVKLILIDFDSEPVVATLIPDVKRKLQAIGNMVPRLRFGALKVFAAVSLVGDRSDCIPIPDIEGDLDDTGALLRVAQRIGEGIIKIAAPALNRSRNAPLAGALDVRAGDTITPLRLAIIQGIVLALEPAPTEVRARRQGRLH